LYFVECAADFALTQILTNIRKEEIIHSGCKSRVIYDLVQKFTDGKGVVDEDLGSSVSSLIQHFQPQKSFSYQQIDVLYHKKRNNYLIILKPYLEAWILRTARLIRVDVGKYGLPNDPKRLHSVINYRLPAFERLLNILMIQSPELKLLSQLLLDP
jgi:hypothetical protein